MIFVTVGTQLPFDRLVRTVDEWALSGKRSVYAQIGPTDYKPRNIGWSQFLSADECHRRISTCSAVIAHAGMGTILTALELGKPVIVMPRRADLREHRNDHQLATARKLLALGRLMVAFDEEHLQAKLEQLAVEPAHERISKHASPQLLGALRRFVAGEQVTAAHLKSRMAAIFCGDQEGFACNPVGVEAIATPVGADR